uniref:Uncharacterized protein n=1 Tax=Ditylenchus dipsaci TaxID=166011 RepID=A0A915DZX0_9BILA
MILWFVSNDLLFVFSTLFAIFSSQVQARSQCVRAKGRLLCPTDPDRQANILVKLLDKDPLPWESDDRMGSTFTDEFGNYTVEGCADDFGQWNDPDPYLKIEHRCPEPGHSISIAHRLQTITIERRYLPEEVHVHTIKLDQVCLHC